MSEARFTATRALKADLFGRVERGTLSAPGGSSRPAVRRLAAAAPRLTRPLARHLMRREAAALAAAADVDGVPRLLATGRGELVRSWLAGRPLHESRPADPAWFGEARRLLVRLHRRGVTHNDTAKEPNWLVRDDGGAALVDFQLARVSRRRDRLFRLAAREDLRHLLKHKRTCCPGALSPREIAILATPSAVARWMRQLGKPLYNLVTRRVLGWADSEGRGRMRAGRVPPPPAVSSTTSRPGRPNGGTPR